MKLQKADYPQIPMIFGYVVENDISNNIYKGQTRSVFEIFAKNCRYYLIEFRL